MALEKGRAGGTLALSVSKNWDKIPAFEALGFAVHVLTTWEDLVGFARAFVRESYERSDA